MRRAACLLAASAVFIAATGAARAEPTWSAPIRIAPPEGSTVPLSVSNEDLAVNARGDVVIGWNLWIVSTGVAQVTWRRAGSVTWSGPVTLAEGVYDTPRVALDDEGNALAVFAPGVLQTSFHEAGSNGWERPITIGPSWPYLPHVSFDHAGSAIVAWRGSLSVQTVERAASGSWEQPPNVLSGTVLVRSDIGLAVDRAGNALAAWVRDDPNGNVVESSYRPFGSGVWGKPVAVSSAFADNSYNIEGPLLAFDDAGGATIAWSTRFAVQSAYRSPAGSWGPAAPITQERGRLNGLVDSAGGSAIALWTTAGDSAVRGSSRAGPRANWSAPVTLSGHERVRSAQLAGDSRGNAVAMWIEELTNKYGGPTSLQASLRPAKSERWEPAVKVASGAGDAYEVDLAMDGRGDAVALWDAHGVELTELKGSGPLLSHLTIPISGGKGVATRFSVTPVPWAAQLVTQPKWEFGDGSSATGNDVRHVYAGEGTYEVRVSAFDANGPSMATGTITIGKPTLANARRPVIRGLARVDHNLQCDRGTWTGTEPITFGFSWLRNGKATARGSSYRVRRADTGALLACRVKATNGPKTASAVSRSVRVRP